MATRKPSEPEPIQTWGIQLPGKRQHFYDMGAFAHRFGIDRAPRRITLFRRISDALVPGWFEWHEWTERMIGALCENQWTGLAGCASSGKTRNVAGFACTWWLCDPDESSVMFCSTSMKALRKRGWAEVQNYYTSMVGPRFGNFVDSHMTWQVERGDDKHAITGIAVEEGGITKVSDRIKGVHTDRQMIVIDEATAVPPAIFEACTNMYSYPKEFLLVMLGNPRSRLDEFGKFCEPAAGWDSVDVDTEEWETRPQLNGKNGIVVRFDAEKSPNIKEGKVVSRHLPTEAKVAARRKALGSENDPSYWSNDRGFWAPEGLTKTIFTESALIKHNGFGKHVFTGKSFQIIGAMDPAFGGGDRAVIRFAKVGEIGDGKWGIEVGQPLIVPLNAKSTDPIHYQLAILAQGNCRDVLLGGAHYQCPPENFGLDATGEGGGLADIMQRTWSPHIMRVEFGGKPSEDAVSLEDGRAACDVYQNKRAEMFFRSRTALLSDQLRGIDRETAKELCSIEYLDDKAKLRIMPKVDYKLKFGKSSDLADTIAVLLEVARRKGFRLAPRGQTVNRFNDWSDQVRASQAVYVDTYQDEHDMDLVTA